MKKLLLLLFFFCLFFNIYAEPRKLPHLYSQAEFDKAIHFCKDKIKESNDTPFYYLNLALLYEETGNLPESISVLKKAHTQFKDSQILFHLGRLSLLSSDNKGSIYFLKQYLARHPKDKRAYFYFGLNYEDLANTKAAIKYYKKALQLDPYFVLPLLRLSKIYFEKKKLGKAIHYLTLIKKYEPSIKSIYKQLALSLFKKKDYLLSFKEANKYLNMKPDDTQMLLVRKTLKDKMGKDYFQRQKIAVKKERQRKKVTVSSFVEGEAIPQVRVQIAKSLNSFEFKSTKEAIVYSNTIPVFKMQPNTLYRLKAGSGLLHLEDCEGKIIIKDLPSPVVLKSKSKTSLLAIFGIKHAEGMYWSKTVDNFLRGEMEVIVSGSKIQIINILNLEEYLYGVLPSEVSASWPEEALAAQAVVARTRAIKSLGLHKKEGYDFCNTVHCQVYIGANRETVSTNRAVDRTRGLILAQNDHPIDVYYSSNCGGHTQEVDSFAGVQDTKDVEFNFPLSPSGLFSWLTQDVNAYCADKVERKSRFRWQRFYPIDELTQILNRKFSFKNIQSLLVLERDISGHIHSLEVKGAERREIINSEFKIRKYLDDLRSSLFRVEIKYSRQAKPEYVIFWGGGFGHGIGLCQYGAKGRAASGESYKRILKDYFPRAHFKKAY